MDSSTFNSKDQEFSIIRVPTCFSKQTTEVNLSSEDMKNIKAKDPFLYYSIPGVRAARMKLKDVNDPEMMLNASILPPLKSLDALVSHSNVILVFFLMIY